MKARRLAVSKWHFSRERKKQHLEDTERMNKQLKQENEMLKQRNAELMKRISFLESELSKVNSWKKGKNFQALEVKHFSLKTLSLSLVPLAQNVFRTIKFCRSSK